MHILLGILLIAGTFLLAMDHMSAEFTGFYNTYSLILLGGVPVGLAVLSYRFSTLWMALKGLGRSFLARPEAERERLVASLTAFGREVRRERSLAASAILEAEKDPVFRHLARQVLQQAEPEEIELDALAMGRRDLHNYRTGEKVLASLGDFAPAMGMVGTIIGLIQLLANMRDFEKLGPGMAIALLTTFYGLLLAHLLYLPLARMVADRAAHRAENLNLMVEAMLKIARRRPMHELLAAVGTPEATAQAQNDDDGGRP